LTNKLVTIENLKLGQFPLLPGTLDKITQSNHRRDIENAFYRMKTSPTILQNLGLAAEQQNYGSAHSAYVEWLIILVKH